MVKSGSVQLITDEGQAGVENQYILNAGQALAPDDRLSGPSVKAGTNGAVIQSIEQAHWHEWHAYHQPGFEKSEANLQKTAIGKLFSVNSFTERRF